MSPWQPGLEAAQNRIAHFLTPQRSLLAESQLNFFYPPIVSPLSQPFCLFLIRLQILLHILHFNIFFLCRRNSAEEVRPRFVSLHPAWPRPFTPWAGRRRREQEKLLKKVNKKLQEFAQKEGAPPVVRTHKGGWYHMPRAPRRPPCPRGPGDP